jgi:hypothetical protein
MVSKLPAHQFLPEPELAFHPERREDRDIHPLRGLVRYGPFSRALVNSVIDPIRVATVGPYGKLLDVKRLLDELERQHHPKERVNYLPEFLGFSRVFGLRVVQSACTVELPKGLDERLASSDRPHLILSEEITRAFGSMEAHRADFDVLAVYLPIAWQRGFVGTEGEDFDLHDYLKAITASRGIPMQIIRDDRALAYFCRCSVMWRLGIALYCKAGGIPWKLTDQDPEMALIGLSYAIRKGEAGGPRFVTCCSQVFDADGSGLEFIAYEAEEVHFERENPFLSRSEMRKVMARSLTLYQRRHGGRVPRRVVIHKSTEFKPEEIEGCFDAWRSSEGLELVQVQQDAAWRGIHVGAPKSDSASSKGTIEPYPCSRGSYMQLGGREVLLWTQGNAPGFAGGRNFYKEGKGIPTPLFLHRFAGHGSWHEPCFACTWTDKDGLEQ